MLAVKSRPDRGPSGTAPMRSVVEAFATGVSGPGARALLIDGDNRGAGWVPISRAASSGSAFAVDVAADVLALDADDPRRGAAAASMIPALVSDGLRPVVIASGRAGHRHVFARVSDPALHARWAARARKLRLDVRRSIRPPLSPHRLGLPVALIYPGSIEAALAALTAPVGTTPRRELSPHMEELLASGMWRGRYRSRSEMLFALALAALNAGWSRQDYIGAVLESRAGEKLRKRGARAGGRYLGETWIKAERHFSPARVVARQASAVELVEQVSAAARATDWTGRSGPTDHAVLLAHIAHAADVRHCPYRSDVRTIADRAGVVATTVSKAQRRLVAAGWLRRLHRGSLGNASTWVLRLPERLTPACTESPLRGGDETTVHVRDGRAATETVHAQTAEPSADVWRARGGLGKGALLVWRAVGDDAVPTEVIVEGLRWRRPRVRRLLARLQRVGLVEKCAEGWRRGSADPGDVARVLGVLGVAARQRRRHAAERRDYRERRPSHGAAGAYPIAVRLGTAAPVGLSPVRERRRDS